MTFLRTASVCDNSILPTPAEGTTYSNSRDAPLVHTDKNQRSSALSNSSARVRSDVYDRTGADRCEREAIFIYHPLSTQNKKITMVAIVVR